MWTKYLESVLEEWKLDILWQNVKCKLQEDDLSLFAFCNKYLWSTSCSPSVGRKNGTFLNCCREWYSWIFDTSPSKTNICPDQHSGGTHILNFINYTRFHSFWNSFHCFWHTKLFLSGFHCPDHELTLFLATAMTLMPQPRWQRISRRFWHYDVFALCGT